MTDGGVRVLGVVIVGGEREESLFEEGHQRMRRDRDRISGIVGLLT